MTRSIDSWSAARWISDNADRRGLPKMGASPGLLDYKSYGSAMLRAAARQVQDCGRQGLLFAHDAELYADSSGPPLVIFAALIAQWRHKTCSERAEEPLGNPLAEKGRTAPA